MFIHMWAWGEGKSLSSSSYEAIRPIGLGVYLYDQLTLVTFLKTWSPNIVLGVRTSKYEFGVGGWGTHFSPQHCPRASQVALVIKNHLPMQKTQDTWVWSLGQEDPLEKEMAPHSTILVLKSHGQRSLVGYSPWGHRELDTTEWLSTYIHIDTVPNWKYISRWVVERKKSNEDSNSLTRNDSSVSSNWSDITFSIF